MVLSKREKYVGIGVGAAVALLALDSLLLTPYFDKLRAIDKQRTELRQQDSHGKEVMDRRRRLEPVWTEIQRGGLRSNASEAESQARRAVLAWAQSSGVFVTALNPDRTTNIGKFQVVSLNATGNGSMPQLARLMWAMETAMIPVRVNEMTITPRREGTDELQIKFVVSTLCLPPDSSVPQPQQVRPNTNSAANSGARGRT